ncbi:opioid growth factor receptor-like [Zea mays]|uniref:opioid growth factor receptor-like n=1 Tax=Zea mays TaxID=4577 RepID=UPI0004DEC045|nr:opioid growth factor receptor-like [Zea mays]|eukprot:XP_020395434.1 opioid growth factor receptor-like [Zea mays]
MVPEDLLSEPTDGGMMDVCTDILDVGLELSRAASRAPSTLECGLHSQEAGLGCSTPMEVTENPSALEVAVAENPVPKDGTSDDPGPKGVAGNDPARVGSVSYNPAPEGAAGGDPAPMGNAIYDPAPEGVRVGSPSHTSMDVHVRSSPPHSDCMAATRASNQEVALETDTPNARVLIPAGDVELIPNDALQIASADIPSSSHQLVSHDLGLPSFFSNLQALVDEMADQLRSQGASIPEGALSLMH